MPTFVKMRTSSEEAAHIAREAARRGLTVASYLRESLGLAPQQRGQRNDLAPPPAPQTRRKVVAR